MHRILSKEVLAPDVVRFWIEGPHIARKRKPGQFVIIRTSEDGERIPLTIADVDKTRGAISIIVQGVGKSTRQLNALNEGDAILDLAGPLGRPTETAPRPEGLLHRRRHRHGRGLPHRVRVQGAARRRDGHHRRAHEGLRHPREGTARGRRPGDRHHRRRVVRREGPGDRCPEGASRRRPALRRSGRRRSAADDARGGRGHAPAGHPDHGQPEPRDGGRHGHVRRVPRVGGRRAEVRLRRRPRVQRAPGGFRGTGRAPAGVPGAGSGSPAPLRRARRVPQPRPADTSGRTDRASDLWRRRSSRRRRTRCRCRTRTSGPTTSKRWRSATPSTWRCSRRSAASSARTSRAWRAARSRSTSRSSSSRSPTAISKARTTR